MKITIEFDDGEVKTLEGYGGFISLQHGEDRNNISAFVGRMDGRDLISFMASLMTRIENNVGKEQAAMIRMMAQRVSQMAIHEETERKFEEKDGGTDGN